ncbi:NEW3 domain-containing protein [Streptomyces orinoci]|uniref:NEW3 domain-containing protein n=2 Tax=Streptomyces orinoci TaxID=67339 RepID=A0ABV3K7Y2_STRON|nr:NEW3 domain-containing protein [Streptomyces orinoci]
MFLESTTPAWSPGSTATVTSTVTNDGGQSASGVRLGLDVPAGWTATPLTPTRFPQLAPGHQAIARFRVTAPAVLPRPITRAVIGSWESLRGPAGEAKETQHAMVELAAPVRAPWKTFTDNTAVFGAQGDRLAIDGAGADLWYHTDQYSAVYRPGAEHDGSTTIVKVTAQDRTNEWAKAGIMVRNDITGADTAPGYVILAVAPGKGYVLQWDSTGSGHLDANSAPSNQGSGTAGYPSLLKLVRSGGQFTGYYSLDGSHWTLVGTATVPGAAAAQDVGVFTSSHSEGTSGEADFTGFRQT